MFVIEIVASVMELTSRFVGEATPCVRAFLADEGGAARHHVALTFALCGAAVLGVKGGFGDSLLHWFSSSNDVMSRSAAPVNTCVATATRDANRPRATDRVGIALIPDYQLATDLFKATAERIGWKVPAFNDVRFLARVGEIESRNGLDIFNPTTPYGALGNAINSGHFKQYKQEIAAFLNYMRPFIEDLDTPDKRANEGIFKLFSNCRGPITAEIISAHEYNFEETFQGIVTLFEATKAHERLSQLQAYRTSGERDKAAAEYLIHILPEVGMIAARHMNDPTPFLQILNAQDEKQSHNLRVKMGANLRVFMGMGREDFLRSQGKPIPPDLAKQFKFDPKTITARQLIENYLATTEPGVGLVDQYEAGVRGNRHDGIGGVLRMQTAERRFRLAPAEVGSNPLIAR